MPREIKPLSIQMPPIIPPVQRMPTPVSIAAPIVPDKTGMAIEMGGVPGNATPMIPQISPQVLKAVLGSTTWPPR